MPDRADILHRLEFSTVCKVDLGWIAATSLSQEPGVCYRRGRLHCPMLDVGHGVNVRGGTVLLDNVLIGENTSYRGRDYPDRLMGAGMGGIGRRLGVVLGLIGLLAWPEIALAQAKGGINLIRDAEIETTLHQITNPILDAAGISSESVNLYIVRDKRLNAFVAGGQNLFLNTGLLQRTEHPG
ncbi:MAG: hypothetical protein ACR2RF_13820, partial [Geminicoccaceae bacterium]